MYIINLIICRSMTVLLTPQPRIYRVLSMYVVAEWCMKWGMSVNLGKANIVHFQRKLRSRLRSSIIFTFNGKEIQYASQYKYLGLLLNEHIDWNVSLEEIISKANRALAHNHRMRVVRGFNFRTLFFLISLFNLLS